jgi:hypothetical protein
VLEQPTLVGPVGLILAAILGEVRKQVDEAQKQVDEAAAGS